MGHTKAKMKNEKNERTYIRDIEKIKGFLLQTLNQQI